MIRRSPDSVSNVDARTVGKISKHEIRTGVNFQQTSRLDIYGLTSLKSGVTFAISLWCFENYTWGLPTWRYSCYSLHSIHYLNLYAIAKGSQNCKQSFVQRDLPEYSFSSFRKRLICCLCYASTVSRNVFFIQNSDHDCDWQASAHGLI